MKYNDVEEFTIFRSKWVRGSNHNECGPTYLLNNKGYKCCLGFYSEACGINLQKNLYKATPADTTEATQWNSKLIATINDLFGKKAYPSFFCMELISLNDKTDITEENREKEIINSFCELGIKVNFID